MKFTFQNLLTINNGTVSGPFSQMKLAEAMVQAQIIPAVSGLIQIRFSDIEIHQKHEGATRNKELTGYGTLAIITSYSNATTYHIVLDRGESVMPVCYYCSQDRPEFIEVFDVYTESEVKQLTHNQLVQLIQELSKINHKPKAK